MLLGIAAVVTGIVAKTSRLEAPQKSNRFDLNGVPPDRGGAKSGGERRVGSLLPINRTANVTCGRFIAYSNRAY